MANRVKGEWQTLIVDKAEDVADKVADVFAKNTYSHNIVFQAMKGKFELYEPLKIKLNNKIFSSYVATIEEQKNSDEVTVTCGELQVTYPFVDLI